MKKHNIIPAIILALFISCKPNQTSQDQVPSDIVGIKALLKEKRQSIASLKVEIDHLENQLIKLDPSLAMQNLVPVRVDTLLKSNFEHTVTVQGALEAKDELYLSSETGGRIVLLNVEEGNYVKKGELVAKIDLETVETQIAELETQLDLAKILYEKQKRLWDQKIGSEIQFLQAENTKNRLEKSLDVLNSQLNKSEIYAPISGIVDMVNLEQGEMATPGAPIIQILNTSRLKVVANIPDRFIGSIQKGQKVEIYFPSIDQSLSGRISLLGSKIDEANRTFKIEVEMSNIGGILKPNLLAEIKFIDYTIENSIIVPTQIIQQEVGGKKFVLVAQNSENGTKAIKKYVKTGNYTENAVIIEEGLDENELIITQGMIGLSNDQPIEILSK